MVGYEPAEAVYTKEPVVIIVNFYHYNSLVFRPSD